MIRRLKENEGTSFKKHFGSASLTLTVNSEFQSSYYKIYSVTMQLFCNNDIKQVYGCFRCLRKCWLL